MKLERVLTKLKFDESVNGYALITSDGVPFLSFALPDEVLPNIQGTLRIHGGDLKLVNVMTDKGIVILARVNPKWVLAVLFEPDFQLGGALSRTKAVVDLLAKVDLPPPPKFPEVDEKPPVSAPEVEVSSEPASSIEEIEQDVVVNEASVEAPISEIAILEPSEKLETEEIVVQYGCVVFRSANYGETMSLDSEKNALIKKAFSNVGIDILLVVDEKRSVYNIAEHLSRPVDKTIEIISWCVSHDIVRVECPEIQEPTQKEIIELPFFEGNIDKVKKKHRAVIELCNGKRTLQEIATEVGILYFEALQTILPYKGKTLRILRTDKSSRF